MKQRFNKLTLALCERAAADYLDGKWRRRDTLRFVEEFAGIAREEIYRDELSGGRNAKNEAVHSLGLLLLDMAEGIACGIEPDIIDPVQLHPRRDGPTQKMREIAELCIPHQMLGHLVQLGLEPLFRVRILPQQHASIPGRGQTALIRQISRYLRKENLGIRYAQKTDGVHAYQSLRYDVCTGLIRREIPRARWIIDCMEYLGKLAPEGHLIIGGYLDAWLFNFAASYALRHALSGGRWRRGKFVRDIVRVAAYMDDMALFAHSKTGLVRAIRALSAYSAQHLGMQMRTTTGIIRFLSAAQEQARRSAKSPAARGCPRLDMGGYQIARTHITLRPRIAKRTMRALDRAAREIEQTGHLQIQRALAIIARNGPLVQCNSTTMCTRHRAAATLRAAKRTAARANKINDEKIRKEMQHALHQHHCRPRPRARAH